MTRANKKRGGLAPDKYHNQEELSKIFKYLKNRLYFRSKIRAATNLFIVQLLFATGLRADELLSLRIKDVPVYHDKPVIYVAKGKGGVARTIYIDNKTTESIRKYIKTYRRRARPNSTVIVNERGLRMSYRSLHYRLQTIAKNAGIRYVRPHMFRHNYAIELYKIEKDLVVLCDQLGHCDVKVTTIYARTVSEDRQRQVDYFGERLASIIQ